LAASFIFGGRIAVNIATLSELVGVNLTEPKRGVCGDRLFQNNSEQPLFIKACQIGAKRFSLANHGLIAVKGLFEGLQAAIDIDVVDHDGAAWPQRCPSKVYLEANVLLGMKTVVNEKIDLAQLRK
jgi:hypothetical protein